VERPAPYWAAILDGEGQIAISHIRCGRDRYLYHRVFVRVGNTSLELLETAKKDWGGSIHLTKLHVRRPNCKPVHLWTIACKKALTFLEAVRPYLIIKAKQADIAIECQRTFLGEGRGFYRIKDSLFDTREKLRNKILALNHRGTKPYVANPPQDID
jgi:hypothetical protein